jgi:signal transduction histidine kinase
MVGMPFEAPRDAPVVADVADGGLAHSDRTAALARLAAGIAHELRNPLAVVLARVQLLQLVLRSGQPLSPERLEGALRAVEDQALRASKVLENLSSFARPRPPQLSTVDLPDLIGYAMTLLRPHIPETGFSVEVDVQPEAKALQADRGQLLTALSQVVLNALEAMPSGGALRIGAELTEGAVEIRVADSGPGIAAGDRSRIFDPFFSTKASAAGLGLCVAQTIAEAHGGSLRLERCEGSGAAFVLILPART